MAAMPFDLPLDAWEIFDVSLVPSEEGLQSYLDRVLVHAEVLFEANAVSLFLRDGRTDVYRPAARHGASRKIPEDAVIRKGVGLAGEAIELRAARLVHATSAQRDVGSAMVVPLVETDGQVSGVLNVSRNLAHDPFGPADLRHADTVARQIALAVGNAKLYSEARNAEVQLRTLLSAMPSPMFVLDEHGEVSEKNPAAEALIDRPPLHLRGRIEHGSRTYWLSAREIPTGGSVVTVDDVTEREQLAAEAIALKHLAEIGRMTATIAHEIRNPLTGIRSAAQLLREAPEHAPEWTEIVEREASRLENLCDQFLEFARPLQLHLAPTDVTELAERVARLQTPAFEEASVGLLLDLPSEPMTVMLDAPKMEQVLHNLLRNAVQACEGGQTVVLRVHRNAVEVHDTGRGMTEEELRQLGRPFFTTKVRGTGLGFGTVRRIVDAHGGSVSVESELGKGTRVTVRLPSAGAEEIRS